MKWSYNERREQCIFLVPYRLGLCEKLYFTGLLIYFKVECGVEVDRIVTNVIVCRLPWNFVTAKYVISKSSACANGCYETLSTFSWVSVSASIITTSTKVGECGR